MTNEDIADHLEAERIHLCWTADFAADITKALDRCETDEWLAEHGL